MYTYDTLREEGFLFVLPSSRDGGLQPGPDCQQCQPVGERVSDLAFFIPIHLLFALALSRVKLLCTPYIYLNLLLTRTPRAGRVYVYISTIAATLPLLFGNI